MRSYIAEIALATTLATALISATEFKVMIRPVKAINLIRERMAAMLASAQGPR
jgi:hypothetical protein